MVKQKLIVMSDSHGDREVIKNIKKHYENQVTGIFHNGDSELPSSDTIWDNIYVVRGNCDFDAGYPDTLVTKLPNLTIAQTHGHLQGINFQWDRLNYLAQEADADICLYGHLHRAAAWREGQTVFVNPGSVLQPRGDVNLKLYALIDVDDEIIKVSFYTLNHELYPALTQEFTR